MATAPITASTVQNATKAAGLSMDDLLKVLLTEVTYQNPLKPVDNKDFLSQMAQFSSLDTTRQLNENLTSMLTTQTLNQTAGLLGKTVDATRSDGTAISGKVTAITMASGEPRMTLTAEDDQFFTDVTLSQIQTIR